MTHLATATATALLDPDPGRYRLPTRVIALFAGLGLVLSTVGIQVGRVAGEFINENARVMHTLEVKQAITTAVASLRDAEASQRAHVISGVQSRLDDYYSRLPQLNAELQQLAALVAADPHQQAAAAELVAAIEQRRKNMALTVAARQKGGLEAVRSAASFNASREEDLRIDGIAERMLATEDAELSRRQNRSVHTAEMTRILTAAAAALCVGMLALALVLILREQKRRLASEGRLRASFVELAQSLDESQRLGQTLRRFSDLGAMLQGCRGVDEAIAGMRVSLLHLLPGCAGSIQLVNASQNLVESVATWGEHSGVAETLFAPDDCWALRRGQPHPLPDAVDAFTCRHLAKAGGATHLCVPLVAQGEILGTLTLTGDAETMASTRAVAVAAGEQMSLALANLKLQDILRTQSLRDPLTGLFNRRYLEASFERELMRAGRRGLPLSVLMLDIDHFKRFNDSHGHDAGDALLAQFGALLTRLVRQEDVACRYGGEEFTVLLHETDADGAAQRAAEICAAVRELNVQHRRQTLGPVTVSIGIATFPQHGDNCAELLRRADSALYAAKHGGRDQARSAG